MNELTQRLQNADEAGVFRLNCELQRLHAVAAEANVPLLETDLSTVHSKGEFLAALAQAIGAPEWFGNNWDALADALQDLSWLATPAYVLLLRNGDEQLGLSSAEHKIALQIFDEAVAFWKSQGKPFWVFFC
jgi:RNAse (barnase) inhibitor barstar